MSILVEFLPGTSGLDFFGLHVDLKEAFGRPVDLLTWDALESAKPNFRYNVEREEKVIYAKTEEELKKIEEMEVPVMSEVIAAYRHVAASDKFIQIEKARSKARHDEAQALNNARKQRDEYWQVVVDEQAAENEQLRSQLAVLQAQLNKK